MWENWERVGNVTGEPLFENIHYTRGSYAINRDKHDMFFVNSIIYNIKEVGI